MLPLMQKLAAAPPRRLEQAATQTDTEAKKLPVRLEDSARGVIDKIAEGEYHSILRITSKKGTVRANHYHQSDSHVCYILSGKLEYVWCDARDASAPLQRRIIGPGEPFYTPPMVAHAMVFLEDTDFLAFTTSPRRTQQDYEDEVVHVAVVDPATVRV